jgi:hypothetical protein
MAEESGVSKMDTKIWANMKLAFSFPHPAARNERGRRMYDSFTPSVYCLNRYLID